MAVAASARREWAPGRWMPWLTLALVLWTAGPRAQAPTLDRILSVAGTYVTTFATAVSNVVIEEHYEQYTGYVSERDMLRKGGPNAYRELKADLLLLQVGGLVVWRPFRDVFEVNGRPIRDRDERLARLFLTPTPGAAAQAARISAESARYNIGMPHRTVNMPFVPLLFLLPDIQPRFRFSLDTRDVAAGRNVWIVAYEERARPTLIRGVEPDQDDVDVETAGRFWIDGDTGEVERATLHVSARRMRGELTTTFEPDVRFGVALPTKLTEEYVVDEREDRYVSGTATYSRYRTFDVQVATGAPTIE
jgi:hypothetical protein